MCIYFDCWLNLDNFLSIGEYFDESETDFFLPLLKFSYYIKIEISKILTVDQTF